MTVSLDGRSLTLNAAVAVVGGESVRLDPASLKRMKKFRSLLEGKLARGEVVYGVNTGFGSLSDKPIRPGNIRELQLNLIRSHSAGVGGHMPEGVVRAAMLIRLNSLLKGHSAVRTEVAEMLSSMLNRGVTPHVPKFGSLGASGDLVPSAHMALTMLGEGSAEFHGRCIESSKALGAAKLRPIVLEAKEGLSLINGTCFTTALASNVVHSGKVILETGNSSVSLAGDVLGACSQSFDARLVGMKNNGGQDYVSKQIRTMLEGSRRVRSSPVPQDPYSIRCAPQVHGALKDALGFAERLTVEEMNSVSDNPVILENGTVLHGGNFHAQPVAMALDLLSFALATLGVMSLARTGALLTKTSPERKYMARRPGLESGLMILQYTATALSAENAKEIYPVSAYPASVSSGVEDHASFGVTAGLKALTIARNVSRILAIEMICASNLPGPQLQGLSPHSRRTLATVRGISPLLSRDRPMADEIERLAFEVISGKLI